MNPATARLKELFAALSDLSESERQAYLHTIDDLDEDLRRQLLALLSTDAELAGTTARSAIKAGVAAHAPAKDWIGARIGAYRIEQELGQGGMGSVFLAQRDDGSVQQQVAIKIVRPEVLDANTIARFRVERQVLALLRHPHIAAMLDLGELDDGSPYVVMEYVDGIAITRYAQDHTLGLGDRLQLMLKVCDAVTHAHRNLIVHRDLKSSNLLVTAQGRPMLLDFGIAKPLVAEFGSIDVHDTQAAQRYFSPHHAAPEQFRNAPVTPACDVYGLGALLYELLSGLPPFDLQGLTPGAIENLVLNSDPLAPSQRRDDGQAAHPISAAQLRGDLDSIVLKCLRKHPEDRYATVDQLAADIRAHLDGYPVAARRGGRWYRSRRFLSRHRIAVSASAVILVITSIAANTWLRQYRATIEQQSRADQMTALIMEAIEAADPGGGNAKDMKVRDLFDRIVDKALAKAEFKDPGLKDIGLKDTQYLPLLTSLSSIQRNIGSPDKALAVIAGFDVATLNAAESQLLLRARAEALLTLGRFAQSQMLVAPGLSVAANEEEKARWWLLDAQIDYNQGKVDQAIAKLEAMDIRAASFELQTERRILLAQCYLVKFQYTKARELLTGVLADQVRLLAPNDPAFLRTYDAMLGLEQREGNFDEAERYAQKRMSLSERLYSRNSHRFARALLLLGAIKGARGESDKALELSAEALPIMENTFGEAHDSVAKLHFNIAGMYHDKGDVAQTESHLRKAVEIAERVWLESDTNVMLFRMIYASQLVETGKFEEARTQANKVKVSGERFAELKQVEYYSMATLIQAMADYAHQQSPENRAALVAAYRESLTAATGPTAKSVMEGLAKVVAGQGVDVR